MSAIDRKKFFDQWRLRFGRLSGGQVKTLDTMLDYWEGRNVHVFDLRWLAYCMATAHGEVGSQLQPVREGFASGDAEARQHVAKLLQAKRIKVNYALPDPVTRKSYYGRGLVQLTHKSNYQQMSLVIGADLVNNPDLALDLAHAVKILFVGMERGMFTSRKLAEFFHGETTDWEGARRIVNGQDRKEKFAELGRQYFEILQQASRSAAPLPDDPGPQAPDLTDDADTPADPAARRAMLLTVLIGMAILALCVAAAIFLKGN